MRLALSVPRWPLLAKELVEIAARPRTYVLRVVYALLLYAAFFTGPVHGIHLQGRNQLALAGVGQSLFKSLVEFQLVGIALFLPPMMCGAVAREKERDSLVLLLLTDLRPWEILLQKYLAGLIPMFGFLLLSLPLAAVFYSFGGVDVSQLELGVSMLFLECLQIGALTLMCSTFCRTTTGALLSSYAVGVIFYVGLPLGARLLEDTLNAGSDDFSRATLKLNPVADFEMANVLTSTSFSWEIASIAIVCSILFFICLSRYFLVTRAFVPPRQRLLNLLRKIDGLMKRFNRLIGGVSVMAEAHRFPAKDPVIWREVTKKPLGQLRYLVRILLVVAILVGVLAFKAISQDNAEGLSGLSYLLWSGAVIVLVVLGANAVAAERINQTLEVLLTTPLSGREIISQKARALWRFMIVFSVPILMLGILQRSYMGGTYLNLVVLILYLFIFLPLFAWLSIWIGLRVRSRFHAILTALGIVLAWSIGVPLGFSFGALEFRWDAPPWVMLCCPSWLVLLNQRNELVELFRPFHSTGPLFIALGAYTVLILLIRGLCLRRADYYLRGWSFK